MSSPVALITGASRGIGRGIAVQLAKNGFDIVAGTTRIDPDATDTGYAAVAAEVSETGQRCAPMEGDISDLDAHPRLFDQALSAFGRIDVLVNNVGVSVLDRVDLLEATPESFDRVMGINLRGPHFFTQRVAKYLVANPAPDPQPHRCIIFVTSISAEAASPNRTEYCMSKAALAMDAQSYAVHLAPHGINVYDVRPGVTATDMTKGVKDKYDAQIHDGDLLLQKRWGEAEDTGKACAMLARGDLAYSTGTVIEVAGGFGVRRL